MIDSQKISSAFEMARRDLLAERNQAGHWVGELSSSALSTATAVSALSIVRSAGGSARQTADAQLEILIAGGLEWLARAQNADGGWGDTDKSYSNIATTMLVRAAFHLAGEHVGHASMLQRSERYIESQGGIAGLRRRYGKDKTFAVPILTNCALAGLVPWSEVSPLPFELACLPQQWFRFARLPVVSYAIPALVAIGQARFHHAPPWNPLLRAVRGAAVERSLAVLTNMQPASGGFLEATPLTSFVVMSLASIGQAEHPVTRRGVQFLIDSVRDDCAWPIDTNLATWNTTLALNALGSEDRDWHSAECLQWLLECQNRQVHPYTGCEPGGWGWSDLSGSVPDVDDTSGALLALADWQNHDETIQSQISAAARAGVGWLLDLQNSDGGWPTFCRGWGTMPFDRSGSDLTAHALRALAAWQPRLSEPIVARRIEAAIRRGLTFLARQQRADGSWVPLWFGNQDRPEEENPVYGTARVILAYRDLDRMKTEAAQRAVQWLIGQQNGDGGWGGTNLATGKPISSLEETALAVEALAADPRSAQNPLQAGVALLVSAVERGGWETSPIGFYFAKLWYYERLYPLTFTVSALRQVLASHPHVSSKPHSRIETSPAQTAHA
jgi:squalene-hopene/tetraprenyl-beta-curcumene cyclase